MKKEINALLIKDIQCFIPNEKPKFLIKKDDCFYTVSSLPIILKNKLGDIWENIAYDYDELETNNKKIYEEYIKKFIYISDNRYKLDTKIYTIKKGKNHFPKQN